MYVVNCGKPVLLADYSVEKHLSEVELWVSVGDTSIKLNMTRKVEAAVLHFLKKHHRIFTSQFGCYELVRTIHSLPKHNRRNVSDYWTPVDRKPTNGDVIFLLNRGGYFLHAAVSMGNGLYLSIFGIESYLALTTMEQMENAWQPEVVVTVVPR